MGGSGQSGVAAETGFHVGERPCGGRGVAPAERVWEGDLTAVPGGEKGEVTVPGVA